MRLLIALSLVAIGLLTFIMFIERDTVSDLELARREGRVLPRFLRDRVERLDVTVGDKTTRLLRKAEDGELEFGTWYVEQPYVAKADQEAVDVLLGELEWMNARRKLQGISAQDREDFGLETPRVVVRYKVGREEGELRVGKASPKGDGHYVATEDPQTAFIVGPELLETLDQPPEYYHDKTLHAGLLLMTLEKLAAETAGSTRVVERGEDRLWMVQPERSIANEAALRTLTDTLDSLQAKRFVRPVVESEAALGLGAPYLDLTWEYRVVHTGPEPEPAPSEVPEHASLRFRVGAPCVDHAGVSQPEERFLVLGESGPVLCVLQEDLAPVMDALAQLREPHLAPVKVRDVDRITLEGNDGERLMVERTDAGFEYQSWMGGQAQSPALAQEGSVAKFLEVLAGMTASTLDGPLAAELADGATGADRELVIEDGTKTLLALRARLDPGGVLVLRDGEERWARFPETAWPLLEPRADRFQNRELWSYAPDSLRSISLSGTHDQRAERDDSGQLALTSSPLTGDAARLLELRRQVARLQVSAFGKVDVAALQRGADTLVLVFDGEELNGSPQERRLEIATTRGARGYAARVAALPDAPAKEVWLDASWVEQLRRPWVDRSAPAIPLAELQELRIGGKAGCRLQRRGEGFGYDGVQAQAGAGAEATADLAQRTAEAWATLRATQVQFAQAATTGGTELEVLLRDGSLQHLWVNDGAQAGEEVATLFVEQEPIAFMLPAGERARLLRCPEPAQR